MGKYTKFTKEEDFFMYNTHIDFGKKYFDNDKKYIDNEFYDRFLKKPLEYAIEHYEDKIERLLLSIFYNTLYYYTY
ncbi:hypothetical protein R4K54_07890 [Brachyspira murdochii]|uniref:Uncharacterized protein n=1 Tax=Brachyspira murdochii (strain ATCC 51284 / DSM 12563 / 56-150) TaxID=526224 RepID=D5U415_BRAM5|nr:hypothetical protein [Brachyspira murdochii]ADG72196.1 hypothetical protein Bmur_2121 [Brachyspira murdochii DSM 12563]